VRLHAARPSIASSPGSREDSLARFMTRMKGNIQSFTLPNGMTFVVYQRVEAPIVSFNVTVNVRPLTTCHALHRPHTHSSAVAQLVSSTEQSLVVWTICLD
jgi:hypothetical protein